jgi:DNA-binding MarR family transcriptional regulator
MAKTDDPKMHAWGLFLLANTLLLEDIEANLSVAGLPPLSWYDVLWELEKAENRKLRMHELAGRIVLSRSNLTRLADRIEAAGLISREDCADDRRGYFLVLVPAGADMRKKMWKIYGPRIEALFERYLTDSAASAMADSFARMIRGLQASAEEAPPAGPKISRAGGSRRR